MKIVVANWKMFLSHQQAAQFFTHHQKELASLATRCHLVICPSTDALSIAAATLKNSGVAFGAQECSAYNPGPFTGQIMAQSLQELGCSYCIVGHSEQRRYLGYTTATIASIAKQLLAHGITPIICVGETAQDYQENKTAVVLKEQVSPILQHIAAQPFAHKKVILAYEPEWAIGTATPVPPSYLQDQIDYLKQAAQTLLPDYVAPILYGGGISYQTVGNFKSVHSLDGIMVGHESTDFQKLEKIVLSY